MISAILGHSAVELWRNICLLLVGTALVTLAVAQREACVEMVYRVPTALSTLFRFILTPRLFGIGTLSMWKNRREMLAVLSATNTEPDSFPQQYSIDELTVMLQSQDPEQLLIALEAIPSKLGNTARKRLCRHVAQISGHHQVAVRIGVTSASGILRWPELAPIVLKLLYDQEWSVRANAARALLCFPNFDVLLNDVFLKVDKAAWDVLIRTIEQDPRALQFLLPRLGLAMMSLPRLILLRESPVLRHHYEELSAGAGVTAA